MARMADEQARRALLLRDRTALPEAVARKLRASRERVHTAASILSTLAIATPRCEARIAFVLAQFAAMGMPQDRARAEEERLRTDDAYYAEWCGDLAGWYEDGTEG